MAKPLSRREYTPAVKAKIDGTCSRCLGPIIAGGSYISKVTPNEKWMHSHCAKAYCRTINEHLEDEAA